jgi:hypothetical protein
MDSSTLSRGDCGVALRVRPFQHWRSVAHHRWGQKRRFRCGGFALADEPSSLVEIRGRVYAVATHSKHRTRGVLVRRKKQSTYLSMGGAQSVRTSISN